MQMTGYVAVALPATAFGPGTAAVKFSADILPANAAQNIVIGIENGMHYPGKVKKEANICCRRGMSNRSEIL
jgi:hypothetical protein